jgi:hypothetical protein
MKLILSSCLLVLTGCSLAIGPATPITRRVEEASGIDPATVSSQALLAYFVQHQDLAGEIADRCSALPPHQMGWPDTLEGRVCGAAWSGYLPVPTLGGKTQ